MTRRKERLDRREAERVADAETAHLALPCDCGHTLGDHGPWGDPCEVAGCDCTRHSALRSARRTDS